MIKNILWLGVFSFVMEAAGAQDKPLSAGEKLKKMEWLLTTWTRTNTKPGKTAHERWLKKSDTEWIGFGVTMQGNDTIFVEKLKIVIENGQLYYVADVPENKKLVYFEMKSVTNLGFVCENPAHDFPKRIEYQRDGSRLKARISAGEKGMDYLFERAK